MKKFMVVCWFYGGEGHELLATNVRFYDSLAQARIFVHVTNGTGDYAQLYMLHGEGPEGYYVYCNEHEDDNKESYWNPIFCAKCGAVLGSREIKIKKEEANNG